ncbi:response regulator transcription factor [Paracoccus sp. NGMCC 1.201697]|uniref:Response regulator transcription factor n=1 Tax=Paracoccus broussonetiae subsp. drimophilus TaxID=3373869 RepID=A0ABW7LGH2_9RHOB
MVYRVAIADDEIDLLEAVAEYLRGHGYEVLTAANAAQFRALVADHAIDVAILDIAMPGEDGLSLARWVRRQGHTGIIFASASGSAMDRIVGLEIGGDDYMSKPYDLRELLARIRSVLRRLDARPSVVPSPAVAAPAARPVSFGPYRIDIDARRLFHAERGEIVLTAAEFDLLAVLARRPNRVLPRGQLVELLGDEVPDSESDRRIDVRIARLRRKIEPESDRPIFIRTIRGLGYVLDTDGAA